VQHIRIVAVAIWRRAFTPLDWQAETETAMDRPRALAWSKLLLLMQRWAIIIAVIAVSVSSAVAQPPERTITMVVPMTPGSGPDILARTIAEELQRRLSQAIVVENKPGASGNIGTQFVARAAPDGHTLLMTANPFTANLSLFKSIPYDPVKSFTPIIKLATGVLALAVHPSVPANSTREFIAYLRTRPGQLNYSSPGVGVPHHLAMELFKLTAKVDMKHVPYRGAAGAMQDLVGGHVSASFLGLHGALPLMQDNQIRLLAIASRERAPVAPHLPTLVEEGLPVEVELWFGIFAPAGTPPAVGERYNKEINEILRVPQIVEKLAKQGLTLVGGTPEHLNEFIARDIVKWQKLLTEAGISSE
jgi:tripartite-type tricarboxylate transporter receptor subunit TctC